MHVRLGSAHRWLEGTATPTTSVRALCVNDLRMTVERRR